MATTDWWVEALLLVVFVVLLPETWPLALAVLVAWWWQS